MSRGPIEEEEKSIQYVSLHSLLPNYIRGDVSFPSVLYVAWIVIYCCSTDGFVALCCLPILILFHILIFLICYWSTTFSAILRYRQHSVSALDSVEYVRVVPVEHCGSAAFCPLQKEEIGGKEVIYFFFQRKKYIFKKENQLFGNLDYPTNLEINEYRNAKGYSSRHVQELTKKYGRNVFDIPLPSFQELYKEHAAAPFFVFQIFCVALWCLDEYWYWSVMTLFMLLVFEAIVVKRRLKNFADLREMQKKPINMLVYRDNAWKLCRSDNLVPGDIVSIVRSKENEVVPCDIVLLDGTCVVNEALLTGESVPQMKESLVDPGPRVRLCCKKNNRRNIVYAGTEVVLQNRGVSDYKTIRTPVNKGCIGFVLRTGFNTSQGDLMRAILFTTERVSVNNAESLFFIFILLIFAVIAAVYVLTEGLKDEKRDRYKLYLHCIMIVTSVVPPELPMELSLAVNTSLIQLAKDKITCTEPFRIPVAGAVEVCCFDKTGTLTSDDFIVRGIAGVNSDNPLSLSPATEVSDDIRYIIAGCHSLANVNGTIIGDPLEKESFNAIDWSFIKSDLVSSYTNQRIQIIFRHPFQSSLKRMACIIKIDHKRGEPFRAVVKGAAEIMKERFHTIPSDYEQTYKHYAQQGCRVLALGYKILDPAVFPTLRHEVIKVPRENIESELTFGGFLILSCPMKHDSLKSCRALLRSSHKVVMITGDHILTACSVATELEIAAKPVLVLNVPSGCESNQCQWVSIDEATAHPFDQSCSPKSLQKLRKSYSLCLSGPAIDYLTTKLQLSSSLMAKLILEVSVFGRISPDQKEAILKWFKSLGLITLMCGDGTNDVGALKQAHVGVALVAQFSSKPKVKKKKQLLPEKTTPSKKKPSVRGARSKGTNSAKNRSNKSRKQKSDQLWENLEDEVPIPRLGDASIASPFTSKIPYITSTINIIRQGRCTLVTTLQMFKILALNCLVQAYSMSVLYLDGLKFGDTQWTLLGLGLAGLFFLISRSKPLKTLSVERPPSKLFTPYMAFTIIGQLAIHMFVLMTAVERSKPYTPKQFNSTNSQNISLPNHQNLSISNGQNLSLPNDQNLSHSNDQNLSLSNDPYDEVFSPNVMNSVVYLIMTATVISNFVANYQGHPFMQGFRENKSLFYALSGSAILICVCALGWVPDINELLELAPWPNQEFCDQLFCLIFFDLVGTVVYAKIVTFIFKDRGRPAEKIQRAKVE